MNCTRVRVTRHLLTTFKRLGLSAVTYTDMLVEYMTEAIIGMDINKLNAGSVMAVFLEEDKNG